METITPRVYVGTYGKYNSGSINGKWLDLEDYADKEDFLKACAELHKERQAWIVNGRVDKCGHRQFERGCYACSHAGEEIPRNE